MQTITFCARSTLNADRVSKHGWGVYFQSENLSDFSSSFDSRVYRFPKRKGAQVSKTLALPETRDKVYRKLIELSPASSNDEIVNGGGGLLERGLRDLSQYGSLPLTANGRRLLVERLTDWMAKSGEVQSAEGIPGFWRDATGSLRLWKEQDSIGDLMLIPFVGSDGLIRACQIRFMRSIRGQSGSYVWLSSSKERSGCGPGAPLHHADPLSGLNKPVLVTEGALKAATCQSFLPDRYVVGNSGVATSHPEIVRAASKRALEIAFDADCFTNPHVARALASLIASRVREQQFLSCEQPTRILTWDKRFKGIDDALIAGATVHQMDILEWVSLLDAECSDAAGRQLAGISLSK